MANKKYKLDGNDYWEASGVYDIGQGDTQRNINDEVATKLATIAEGAEVNQNAFSNVTVGGTTIAADSKTDTLTLTAGSNITLTPNATNDSVTIAAEDTTYSNATQSAAGLMSSADKTKLDNLDSSDIADDSDAGGATVKASLNNLKGSLNSIVIISDTQPSESENEIWLPDTVGSGISVPTWADLNNLVTFTGLDRQWISRHSDGRIQLRYYNGAALYVITFNPTDKSIVVTHADDGQNFVTDYTVYGNKSATGTITKAIQSGTLDIYATTCEKSGNMVVASGRIYDMTGNDGTSKTYFNLPEGFRPPDTINCVGYMRVETSTNTANPTAPMVYPTSFNIRNDGAVITGLGSGYTVSQVSFATTFFI